MPFFFHIIFSSIDIWNSLSICFSAKSSIAFLYHGISMGSCHYLLQGISWVLISHDSFHSDGLVMLFAIICNARDLHASLILLSLLQDFLWFLDVTLWNQELFFYGFHGESNGFCKVSQCWSVSSLILYFIAIILITISRGISGDFRGILLVPKI